MKTDLCTEDVVVHIGTDMITTETSPGGGGGGAETRGAAAAGENGRRLLLAARQGDTAAVRALMAKGAPFTTDWLGTSPLHVAALHAHADTVAVLLRAGVSRDARTKVDRTALHVAAEAGHADVVRVLLEHGAQVDARDLLRMTPLHWAAERGHGACCALLLRAGADAAATSKFLKTPLALARRSPELLQLFTDCLKEREAQRSIDAIVADASQSAQEAKKSKPAPQAKAPTEADSKSEAAAAQLLRAHGITLLPADDGSTVLNALQSGRTVVLSDAGKLMLKESRSAPASAAAAAAAGDGRDAAGVVLTATPVQAPPPGCKVFTLSNATKLANRKDTNEHQVKFVQVSEARAAAAAASAARPAVKIVMSRANFRKLVATAHKASPPQPASAASGDESVVVVPEQFVRSTSPQYLRSQLLCAHAALHELAGELRDLKARLALYEP